ncbi:MAG: glycosyltransferase [ANME-2 cluster archaeon]|nr:MAG: glycosyltransferase [ANME-2 cluster archaeon]
MGCEIMEDIKVSLICTLKNEELSIGEFLDSLLSQSRQPDEIIIVDGGSTDGTVDIIKSYIEQHGAPIKLIIKNGANIAQGRNIAIKNAKYDIIASTDAGCKVDENWLQNLVIPFEKDPNVDVVSGWYEANINTDFEKCVVELTYPKLEQIIKSQDDFLPSSRSVAYKKDCWEKIGGYPEWLYTAEDTLFDLNLKKAGCKFVFASDAIVRWDVRPNVKSTLKQHYLYARGDGHAKLYFKSYLLNIGLHGIGTLMLIAGFMFHSIWILLLVLLFIYLFKPTLRVYNAIKIPMAIYLIPFIVLMVDLARLIGYSIGILQRKSRLSSYSKK